LALYLSHVICYESFQASYKTLMRLYFYLNTFIKRKLSSFILLTLILLEENQVYKKSEEVVS